MKLPILVVHFRNFVGPHREQSRTSTLDEARAASAHEKRRSVGLGKAALSVAGAFMVLVSRPEAASADPSSLVPQAGYNYGDIETARSIAMGGAVRALGGSSTALYANPANLALTRVYQLGAMAQVWPEPRRQTYGATIIDSTRNYAGGVGAQYAVLDPDGLDRKWTDIRAGFAYAFSDKLFAGISGRYLKLTENGTSVHSLALTKASGGLSGQPVVDELSFDAGITVMPTSGLALSIFGANLTNPGTGLAPTQAGGAVGYGSSDFTIEGDVVADITSFLGTDGKSRTTFRAMAGFEYLVADHFPLRVAYRYDSGLETHFVSGGAGYVDPQFSIEVGLRRSVSGPEMFAPTTALVIGLSYFLDSSTVTRGPSGEVD